ncbi:hypothetical protein [Brooklawnia cerclae]|uniref:Uncharacterized protein n=2 Tax=Brooklawnia cerclae TaxID=349934 RepID=A0ABX0SN23_9ACTN|nr:hypothetical protein [Brooklawnia cerclae]NIH58440.1 hypothetical protein [Brooklawnia cerclae]
MAEIRKHRPRTSAIGDVVRASVGAVPRPVTPGEPQPSATDDDPFFVEDAPGAADSSSVTDAPPVSAAILASEGWFSLAADAVQALAEASRPHPDAPTDQDE